MGNRPDCTVVFLLSHPPDPRIIKRINSILRCGFRPSVIFWNRIPWIGKGYECLNIPIVEIGRPIAPGWGLKRFLHFLLFGFKCWPYIRKAVPEVLYCSGPESLLLAVLYKVFYPGVKLVYEVADIQWINKRNLVGRLIGKVITLFEKVTLPRAVNLLVLTSPFYWDEYYSSFIEKGRIVVLPNCPPRHLFSLYRRKPFDNTLVVGWIGIVRY